MMFSLHAAMIFVLLWFLNTESNGSFALEFDEICKLPVRALSGSPIRANPGTGARLFLCRERLETIQVARKRKTERALKISAVQNALYSIISGWVSGGRPLKAKWQ
jgi:hypothetical protein